MSRKQMKVNSGGSRIVEAKDQKPTTAKKKKSKSKTKTVKGGDNGAN
jgi:hypothetical protein